jgi:peptidoglycan/xylan/chitin deacetylase (PgdA/CDA1 family)
MKKRFLLLFGGLLAIAAAAGAVWALCRPRVPAPRDIPVLMYHNVLPAEPGLSVWQVSTEEFAWQMDQLAQAGYESILPEDIARAAAGRGKLPEKPVVITFDDGYAGVMENAEPILAKHGFKAICYAIVGLLSGEGEERRVFDSGPLLTTNEAVAMHGRGVVSVGSHSLSHARNPMGLAEEIGLSRKILKSLGVDTRDYCYPFGLHGYDYMYDALRANGFHTAFICDDEMFRFGAETNLLAIPRVSVYGGEHGIALAEVSPERSEVVFSNTGRAIPLRAVVRDESTSREWKGELQSVGPKRPAVFSFPPEAFEGPRTVEAWDKFGLFRYYP